MWLCGLVVSGRSIHSSLLCCPRATSATTRIYLHVTFLFQKFDRGYEVLNILSIGTNITVLLLQLTVHPPARNSKIGVEIAAKT